MRISSRFVAATLLAVLLSLPPTGQAQTPSTAAATPRVDRYDDALPDGAIARLGTLRLTHLGHVFAVAVSPDAALVASAVRRGTVRYRGDEQIPESELLASEAAGVLQATVRLWSVKTGELIREMRTRDAPATFLRFSADGGTLFAGCDRYVCCWETRSGKLLWERDAVREGTFEHEIRTLDLMQAGDTLVSMHEGSLICAVGDKSRIEYHYQPQRFVRFWNRKTGAPIPLPKALESTVAVKRRVPVLFHEAAVSADLTRAAVLVGEAVPLARDEAHRESRWTRSNRRLEVIDLASGRVLLKIDDAEEKLSDLAFTTVGHGLAIAAVGAANRSEIWFLPDVGAPGADGEKRIVARDLPATISGLKFIAGVGLAAFVGDSIQVWDVAVGKRVERHSVREESQCPGSEGRAGSIAATATGNSIRIRDIESDKPLHDFEGHRRCSSALLRYSLASPNTLLSRDEAQILHWDTRTWKVARTQPLPTEKSPLFGFRHHDFDDWMSVDRGLYVHSTDLGEELRDLKTGDLVRRLEDSSGTAWGFSFSLTGNRIARRREGSYRFFDAATGKQLGKAVGDRYGCLSSHGTYFAIRESGAAVGLFDVESGRRLRTLVAPFAVKKNESGERAGGVLDFRFSTDERLLLGEVHEAEGDWPVENVTIPIWSVDTGEVAQQFAVASSVQANWRQAMTKPSIGVLRISDDNRLVALTRVVDLGRGQSTNRNVVEIWEVASGEKRGEFQGNGPVADLAFSSDGRQLASSSDDSTILVWDLCPPPQPKLGSGRRPTEQELAERWATLTQPDAVKAHVAIRQLVEGADESVRFLRNKLRSAAPADAGRVRKLIADLGNQDYRTRSAAHAELAGQGEAVLFELEQALKRESGAETQKRLKALVENARIAARPFGTSERLGQWRALEVLERIGNPMAAAFLHELARGAPGARLAVAAQAAAARLETAKAAAK